MNHQSTGMPFPSLHCTACALSQRNTSNITMHTWGVIPILPYPHLSTCAAQLRCTTWIRFPYDRIDPWVWKRFMIFCGLSFIHQRNDTEQKMMMMIMMLRVKLITLEYICNQVMLCNIWAVHVWETWRSRTPIIWWSWRYFFPLSNRLSNNFHMGIQSIFLGAQPISFGAIYSWNHSPPSLLHYIIFLWCGEQESRRFLSFIFLTDSVLGTKYPRDICYFSSRHQGGRGGGGGDGRCSGGAPFAVLVMWVGGKGLPWESCGM